MEVLAKKEEIDVEYRRIGTISVWKEGVWGIGRRRRRRNGIKARM